MEEEPIISDDVVDKVVDNSLLSKESNEFGPNWQKQARLNAKHRPPSASRIGGPDRVLHAVQRQLATYY